jgi:hypothetical protein
MDLGFLGPLYERQGPWASVYFDTTTASEDAAARQKLNAKSAREQLKRAGCDEATCRAVYEWLVALPRGRKPAGHAVFATHGEVVLDTELTAQPPGGGPLVAWQPLPRTGPLVELANGDPPGLVAYIDRKGADFELTGARGDEAAGSVAGADWPLRRTPTGDWSERHFQTAVENTWEQNAAEIADELRRRWYASGAELLILAGEARERNSVYEHLPLEVRERTVQAEHGVRADSPAAGPEGEGHRAANTAGGRQLLAEEIDAARRACVRSEVAEALERFQAGREPDEDGRLDSVEGVPALVRAARDRQIGVLFVRPEGADLRREVWVGDDPGQVTARRSESQYLGEPEPYPARADDALMRCAAVSGAEVMCVRNADIPEGVPHDVPDGGLGALLRWPLELAVQKGGVQHAAG